MDNYFLNELRNGVTPETLATLLANAVTAYEAEVAAAADKARFDELKAAVIKYIGADNDCWNVLDPVKVTEAVTEALDVVVSGLPVVNCTEHKCSCGEDCSCDDKIVAKMVMKDKNGTTVKELTQDEINDILDSWLSYLD